MDKELMQHPRTYHASLAMKIINLQSNVKPTFVWEVGVPKEPMTKRGV